MHRLTVIAVLALVPVTACAATTDRPTASRLVAGPAKAGAPAVLQPPRIRDPGRPGAVGGHDNRVYVVGDSVLLGTVDTLPAALHGWRVTMNCEGGRRLTEAIPLLRSVRRYLGAVVVIQMGNNFISGEDGTFASQLNTAMRILRRVRRVVWVTVAAVAASRAHIDRTIRRAAARWPTMRVVDWAPIAAAHPKYTFDGLHLTTPGRLAMARLIARAVGPAPARQRHRIGHATLRQ